MHKIIQYGLWTSSALALALTLVACGTNGSKNRCSSDNDCAGDRVCTQNQTCSSIGTSLDQGPNLPAIGEDQGPSPGSGGGGGSVASCETLCAQLMSLCAGLIDDASECLAGCAEATVTAELSSCILGAMSCEALIQCDGGSGDGDNGDWDQENNWNGPGEPGTPVDPTEPTEPPPPQNGTGQGLELCELIDCYRGCESEACADACEASGTPAANSQVDRLETCFDVCDDANDFETCVFSTCPSDVNDYLSC